MVHLPAKPVLSPPSPSSDPPTSPSALRTSFSMPPAPRTVFDDPAHFNLKHPLATPWTLYADVTPTTARKTNSAHWGQAMERLADVDSVEAFMGLYHNTPPPSQLSQRASFYLFREGINPAWEDPSNIGGGSWSVQFPRDKFASRIDELWLNTMLGAIGEMIDVPFPIGSRPATSLDEPSRVTGIALAARPGFYRLNIWTRQPNDAVPDAHDDPHRIGVRTYDVGLQFKTNILGFRLSDKLNIPFGSEVEFQTHEDAGRKTGRRVSKVII